MATSTVNPDQLNGRSSTRQRPTMAGLREYTQSPRSPRTPNLGRSISQQFGSPGNFRVEQEDILIYELGARHFSAGFAGESQPRCILPFTPDGSRRLGDYRQYAPGHRIATRSWSTNNDWEAGYELYKLDIRDLDLGLVEDRLDRALRTAMVEYLQLDAKPRKAILMLPSMLPTPLLEVALKVLFGHFTLPPSIALFTRPVMCCVSAGLRHGLVIDIGWEDTVVSAVSEYKQVARRHSIRAGKLLTREMANTLEDSIRNVTGKMSSDCKLTFAQAEAVTLRFAWCRAEQQTHDEPSEDTDISLSTSDLDLPDCSVPFGKFAEPAEKVLFASDSGTDEHDDHDLPIQIVAYRVLLMLPVDVRALCVSRIIVAGDSSTLPSLQVRLLREITHLIDMRGWDPVTNYGSAKSKKSPALQERSGNILQGPHDRSPTLALSATKLPLQESVPHADRVHDDIKDPVTLRIGRESAKGREEPMTGTVRGVKTLGPWAGASLAAALRIKGVHEIEREDFQKHGLRNSLVEI